MPRPAPRILVLPGSNRTGSFNAQLAALAAKRFAMRDIEVTRISLTDYPLPIYDGDLEGESGVPEPAKRLAGLFAAHSGIFLTSPEYNSSVTPLLKNTIDWISRVRPAPGEPSAFRKRVFAVGAASPGAFGGMRSLMTLRQVLEIGIGATVIPEQVVVPGAATAFDDKGELTSERTSASLDTVVGRLVDEAARWA
ncbi:NADPH-dependent FMN reductase [Methylobrevis pamukkalensis]|uniref:NADPH azoreductase n=1 Tax=Methylobrevis pamukkalensis TaxID=1439726 RepID=A0A1E3H4Q0_9HYPH|nr:NAD(P)H-dependent oxidoreductase [Methylobrevis pamukkalensis]ODN71303.1 NADPH azoreductase [Methylobrevis pamukkalensis]